MKFAKLGLESRCLFKVSVNTINPRSLGAGRGSERRKNNRRGPTDNPDVEGKPAQLNHLCRRHGSSDLEHPIVIDIGVFNGHISSVAEVSVRSHDRFVNTANLFNAK